MQAGSWRSILLIFFYAELIAACHGKSLALVPDVVRTFGVDAPTASWVIGAVAVVAAISAPVGGWLIDRLGELRAIRFGLVIATAGSAAGFFATRFDVLIACRLFEGIGYIAVVLGALALLIRTTEGQRQTTALAFWSVASPMGGALAIAAVSPIAGTPLWQWVFAGHAVLLLVALFLTPFLPEAPARPVVREPIRSALSIYSYPAVLGFLGAIIFLQIFKLGAGSALPTFLMNEHGVPPAWIGVISAGSIACSVGGGIIAGFLFNRGANVKLVATSGALVSAVATLLVYAPSMPTSFALAAQFVGAVSGGLLFAWITTNIPKVAPDPSRVGATGGAVSQLLYLGMAIGPSFMFFILAQPSRLPLILAVVIAYGLPLIFLRRKASRRGDECPGWRVEATDPQ
ncbi:MFS transporter [Sphingomonas sp. DBB INV C78]|uniref:MFS transporter n=1 Tax=Sphingomonas sp. DBB INV C78 TaxID=3349434 RepID=UPI0036D2776A